MFHLEQVVSVGSAYLASQPVSQPLPLPRTHAAGLRDIVLCTALAHEALAQRALGGDVLVGGVRRAAAAGGSSSGGSVASRMGGSGSSAIVGLASGASSHVGGLARAYAHLGSALQLFKDYEALLNGSGGSMDSSDAAEPGSATAGSNTEQAPAAGRGAGSGEAPVPAPAALSTLSAQLRSGRAALALPYARALLHAAPGDSRDGDTGGSKDEPGRGRGRGGAVGDGLPTERRRSAAIAVLREALWQAPDAMQRQALMAQVRWRRCGQQDCGLEVAWVT